MLRNLITTFIVMTSSAVFVFGGMYLENNEIITEPAYFAFWGWSLGALTFAAIDVVYLHPQRINKT